MFRHFFAEPIPAPEPPFRISTRGVGIYETRDGRQAKVTRNVSSSPKVLWEGNTSSRDWTAWFDNGRRGDTESKCDLVRYISPLPEPEKWTPTCELRFVRPQNRHIGKPQLNAVCHNGYGGFRLILEQKWTRGDDEQWRQVEVTQ